MEEESDLVEYLVERTLALNSLLRTLGPGESIPLSEYEQHLAAHIEIVRKGTEQNGDKG